jgi:uncharacterized protein
MQNCYLVHDAHIPVKARFPAIDAHNHLWAAWDTVEQVVQVMDAVGVAAYCDLTANVELQWVDGGYAFRAGDIRTFRDRTVQRFPGRFYGFTTATFTRPVDQPLFTDARQFVEETIAMLHDHVQCGARGLKILKELGLRYRDGRGNLVFVDDERLAPVWEEAGKLGLPVLMHQADPVGFFEPVAPENEHYDSLLKYPSWSFADPKFPRRMDILERRNRVLKSHPRTTFMLPHGANYPENLFAVAQLLDANPNVYIDFSARSDELGRQPYTARDFMIRYQDRIYFGTDMPASMEVYRFYFRFLETFDEAFVPPDYDGTFGRYRWRVCGLGLPDAVLKKIYHRNILRVVPGLAQDVGGRLMTEG